MGVAEAKAGARNEAARAAMPRAAGPWTVGRCGACGAGRGMPASPAICVRCRVTRDGEEIR